MGSLDQKADGPYFSFWGVGCCGLCASSGNSGSGSQALGRLYIQLPKHERRSRMKDLRKGPTRCWVLAGHPEKHAKSPGTRISMLAARVCSRNFPLNGISAILVLFCKMLCLSRKSYIWTSTCQGCNGLCGNDLMRAVGGLAVRVEFHRRSWEI